MIVVATKTKMTMMTTDDDDDGDEDGGGGDIDDDDDDDDDICWRRGRLYRNLLNFYNYLHDWVKAHHRGQDPTTIVPLVPRGWTKPRWGKG
jgi:hypothetical protein